MKLSEATYFPDAKELTRHGFVSHMEDFIGKLIGDNPLSADVDDYLKGFGFDAPKAIKILTKPEIDGVPETAVVMRTERIKSGGIDENGEQEKDEFQVTYKIPKKDMANGIKGIDEKLRNLYIKLFENHIVKGTVLNEEDGGDGGAFGDMGGNGGSSSFSLGADGSYPYFDTPAFKKKNGSTDVVRRSISTYSPKTTNESKKKMKRPIGRLTMFITEEQMRELAKLLKEEGEDDGGGATTKDSVGAFEYDAPVNRGNNDDDFWGPATKTKDIFSSGEPVGHDGRSVREEKSGIHIDPENKGKFTATKKRTGKSTSELLHSPNKKTRARANFARMAKRGWKPLEESFDGGYTIETPSKWKHLKDRSSYNHNYYLNPNTGEIILEECDDDNYFEYFLVDENLNIVKRIGEYYYDDYEGPGMWIWDSDKDVTLFN